MAYSKQNFQDGQILTAANLEKMENGIIAGQGAKNLLDNSDFSNPINSKGKSSYSTAGNEYTIDRWKTQYGTGLTVENGYINVIGNWQIYQTIKNPKDGVYTFAVEACINAIGDYTPNMDIGGKIETSFGTNIGEWKTHILQYDLSTITDETVTLSIAARGGSSSGSISVRWAALYKGSYTSETLPPYVPKGKQVEMLNCGVSLAPHNLLDNSDFSNPVNQRGQSSYSGITYTIDRWRSWDSNNITTLNDGNISVSVHIVQNIPKNRFKNGSSYTIALCALDGTLYVNSGVYTPDAEDFGDWTHTWVEITDSGDVAIYLRNGTYVWAALYEGSYDASTLPAYQPKGYAAELAECQRYYLPLNNQLLGSGYTFSDGAALLVPRKMRIDAPSFVSDGTMRARVNGADYTLTLSYVTTYGSMIKVDFACDNIPMNYPCAFYSEASSVSLNADL